MGTGTLSYTCTLRIKQMVGKYISYIDPICGILSFKRILNLYSPKPRYRFFSKSPSISPMFKGFDSPPPPPSFQQWSGQHTWRNRPFRRDFCFLEGPTMVFFREKLLKVLLMIHKSGVHQLSLVINPVIYGVFLTSQAGAGVLNHQQYVLFKGFCR